MLRTPDAFWFRQAESGATLADLMGRLGRNTPAMAMTYQHGGGGLRQTVEMLPGVKTVVSLPERAKECSQV
ncbi:MAG: hypothetical protein ACOH1Y_13985 [Propionicimonas sp.]